MKHNAPQHDLAGQEDVFNLHGETGIDWARVRRENAQKEADRQQAEAKQTDLFGPSRTDV